MKAIIVSYGHVASGLTLAKHLSSKIDLTFLLAVYGERFERGLFNLDLRTLPYGLIKDTDILAKVLPEEITSYIGGSFKLILLRTHNLKILKDWRKRNFGVCLEASRYIRANGFDVVHFDGSSGFQIYFHLLLLDKPKVYTIHDYLPHSGEENRNQIRLNRIFSKLDYQFIQHSKRLRENFINRYGVNRNKVEAIYTGPLDIYMKFKKEKIEEEPFTILFWGRISKYKGLMYLVRAADIIKREFPEIKIIIAGKGDLGLSQEDLGDKVFEIHNHYIDNPTLVRYIQRSSLVVLPYTDATQSAVLMTACAFHKPVVATDVGGIPEVVENGITGLIVPPRDSQKLAGAIMRLLGDEKRRKEMAQNIGNKICKGEFDWDFIAKKTIEVYKRTIKSKR